MRKHSNYKPRPLHVPVTRGLFDEFGQVLHFAIMAAEMGRFSVKKFDEIAGCINCIRTALVIKPPKDAAIITVIDGAIRVMNTCSQRGDKTGNWVLTSLECASVAAGARKAEEALQKLDVMTLYAAIRVINTEERKAA